MIHELELFVDVLREVVPLEGAKKNRFRRQGRRSGHPYGYRFRRQRGRTGHPYGSQ